MMIVRPWNHFDKRYQERHNGPLSVSLRSRIGAVKGAYNFTLAGLGNELGFSASFLGNLIMGRKAIRTKHIAELVRAVARLEQSSPAHAESVQGEATPSPATKLLSEASLEELAARVNALGFQVTFSQLPKSQQPTGN
jgi:hypothetical protein